MVTKKAEKPETAQKPATAAGEKSAQKPASAIEKIENALLATVAEADELAVDLGLAGAVEPAAKKPKPKG